MQAEGVRTELAREGEGKGGRIESDPFQRCLKGRPESLDSLAEGR